MRVPYEWLREYVEVDLPPGELAEALTRQGLAVEEVERGADFTGVVVGRVLAVEEHPDADRLRVCRVDVGDGGVLREIVCGAPNVAVGQAVPVAVPGAVLSGGFRIESRVLRGVTSHGMICSARELGLEDETEGKGIMVLPGDPPPGRDVREVLGRENAVLILELTPNYATHCQSMIGVAREVGALAGKSVSLPPVSVREGLGPVAEAVTVRIEAPDLCRRYVARIIRGVRIGPSPEWMKHRLEAAGMRSINNIVDVTNYVMLEMGQPLHAFDYERLRPGSDGGKEVVIRRAAADETFVTLDDVERRLTSDDLVIADGVGTVALAGVMGGENSEVGPKTADILLESAHFEPLTVRRTARRLGIPSESSVRFEKWVDPEGCLPAADRAIALIQELAGGEVMAGAVDVYPRPAEPRRIPARPDRINGLLGTDISMAEMVDVFRRLGFDAAPFHGSAVTVGGKPSEVAVMEVTVPSRRPDVEGEADLAEEVARLYGYDHIPVTSPRSPANPSPRSETAVLSEAVREVCLASGLNEAMTYSFMNPAAFDRLGLPADDPRRRALPVANPLTEDQRVMRTCVLPQLLNAVAQNIRHRQEAVALFEIGRIYLPGALPPQNLPEERLSLAITVTGGAGEPSWLTQSRDADFYDLKGIVEAVCRRLGLDGVIFEPASLPGFHPGRTAALTLPGDDTVVLGYLGEFDPAVQKIHEVPDRILGVELDLTEMIARARPTASYSPLPRFPSSDRDLAFLLADRIPAARAASVIAAVGGPLLVGLRLFDVYRGSGVPDGWRSLAYSLEYRADDHTLTDEEVEEVHARVRRAVEEELEGHLRS